MDVKIALAVFKGVLFMLSQQPVNFDRPSGNIWISDPTHVEARITGHGVQLRSIKESSSFYVSGLTKRPWKLADPQWVIVASPATLEALSKCPNAALTVRADSQLEFHGDAVEWEKRTAGCRFDDLALGRNSQLLGTTIWSEKEALIGKSGFEILRSRWINGKKEILVKGDSDKLARIQSLLSEMAPFYKIEFRNSASAPGRTVQFQLTLFEVSRSRALKLGMNWPQQISFKELLEKNRVANGLVADFAENLGIGRILAQPMLRTLPGEKVSFQSGGEFPIEIKTEKEFSTVFKNYGLILEITPDKTLIPGESEISIEFKAELSEPDFGLSAGKSPGLSKRLLSSRFDLRMDESTVLGSMFQSRSSASRSGLAGLVEIPIINWFFSSKDRNTNDTDLWFGIRPTWLDDSRLPDFASFDEPINNL